MLNTIALLIPVLMVIVFIEWYVSYRRRDNKYTTRNFMMNLAIGTIDQISSLFYFTLLYLAMDYVYRHYRIIDMRDTWYQWIYAYIAVDFISYWYHRFSHRVNILWAGHVTHHSSEHFNFSNGFRTSFFQGINRIIFWSVLPVFGFSPLMLVIILKVSGLYDFILHSAYIPKLGFLEKILITPSLHRVHHGKNDIYIDKNYGSTFVIWDKLFGTFQEETETVQYGIKSEYIDNNPFRAIGHYYQYLWQTMVATPRWSDKIKLLFMPPEWKPQYKPEPKSRPLYDHGHVSHYLKHYALFQIVCCTCALITMLVYKDFVTRWEVLLYSAIGITAASNSAMVFNDNVSESFISHELTRLGVATVLMFATLMLYAKGYMVSIVMFLMLSIVLAAATRTHNDTHTSHHRR